jgi:hypothetical protein
MTTQSLAFRVGMVGALALAACNSGGSSAAGTTGGSSSSAGSTSAAGAGGAPSCTQKTVGDGGSYTYNIPGCDQAITNGGVPCRQDTAGVAAYKALATCASSSCATPCAAFVTAHGNVDSDCDTCLLASCSMERTACREDMCFPGDCP